MKPIEQLDAGDAQELLRLKRVIKTGNAAMLDREVHTLREMGMYQLCLYDPLGINVINTFEFRDKDAAEMGIEHAKTFD